MKILGVINGGKIIKHKILPTKLLFGEIFGDNFVGIYKTDLQKIYMDQK